MSVKSTIERVQGGYEVIAPCGYHLGSEGEHTYLCHSLTEAEIAAEKFYPCSCDRECVEARSESATIYRCDDCESVWSADQLLDIDNYFQRVTPGGKVPDGQCRECGALCFEEETPEEQAAERLRLAAPALLAALEGIVASMDGIMDAIAWSNIQAGDDDFYALTQARAAIRRARGVSA